MDISFTTIINTIFYIGALQGIILAFFLYRSKTNIISNRLLGILTLLWAIILLIFALQSQGLYREFPHLLRTFYHTLFAWFPLLYLSIKYLFSSHPRFKKSDLIHFLPMLLSILLHFDFYLKSGEEKIAMNLSNSGYYYILSIVGEEVLSIQGIVYTIFSIVTINRYKRNVVNLRSSVNIRVLSGYKIGVILALIAWSIGIIAAHVEMFGIDLGIDLFLVVYLFFVAIIYWLSILILRSPEVYKLAHDPVRIPLTTDTKQMVISKSKLQSKEDIKEYESINRKLMYFLENEKPFLDPELSLHELSNKLDTSRHHLSAVINKYQKMNFFEMINTYRVNEVVKLMANPGSLRKKNYELAFDAGFNSKASFYRIFKQFTGQTPSGYRSSFKND